MVLTRLAKVLLCFLGIGLPPFWQEGFAQHDPRAAPEVSSLKGMGRVSGRVIVGGSHDKPKPLPVFKNRSFCGSRVPNETLLVGREGGLRNAVVTLHPLDRNVAAQPMPLVLDNTQCAFAPHLQVGAVGSELLLKNSDPTVHARMGNETLFNVGLPTWQQVTKRLDCAGHTDERL